MKTVYVLSWDYYMPTAHEYIVGVYDTPEQATAELLPLARELLKEETPMVRDELSALPDDELLKQFWEGEWGGKPVNNRYPIATYRITETTYHPCHELTPSPDVP